MEGRCGAAASPGRSRRSCGVTTPRRSHYSGSTCHGYTQALVELSGVNQTEAFATGDALTNATLQQFDVPSSLNASAVLGALRLYLTWLQPLSQMVAASLT